MKLPRSPRDRRLRWQRGQASLELALALPIVLMFIIGIVAFGQLAYTHLAVLTATQDCVIAAAQATNPYHAIAQGNAARTQSLAGFSVSQQVTTAGIVAYSGQSSRGVTTPERYACQVGYPAEQGWLALLPGDVLPARLFSLQYNFTFAAQPYKSNWEATP